MFSKRFENKIALITGASSGIGAATARRLFDEGAQVSLFARRGHLLRELMEEIRGKGGDGLVFQGDVTDNLAIKDCVKQTFDRFGRIDVLVNNAGAGLMMPLAVTSEEKWQYNIDVNLSGTIRFIKNVQPIMTRSNGGVIVNMSSVHGLYGAAGISIYSMVKGGIIMLTKSLAIELAPRNIRVNAIAPGIVETDLTQKVFKSLNNEQIDKIRKRHLLGFGSVEDIASAIAYVASDEARWMTGTILTIDGGYSAG